MTICYFNLTTPPPRDVVYLRGLQKNGIEILECIDDSTGIRKFLRLFRKHRALHGKYNILWIGYSGHLLVPFARLISNRPIIFNALASLYDGMVLSRKRYGILGWRIAWYWILDFIAFRCAAITLVESNAQKEYLKRLFFLPDKKFLRAWTGVDEEKFFYDPSIKKLSNFTVVFRGAFLPESGVQYIAEATKILKDTDIRFRIIGNGMMAPKVKEILSSFDAKNVEWIAEHLSPDDLRQKMQECHLSLGQLSDHPRLDRTIPFKVFEGIAMKLPYLTARNKGILELMKEDKTCLCCNPADAEDLAKKIMYAKDNSSEMSMIAEKAYNIFEKNLRSSTLAKQVIENISPSS